MTVDFAGQPGCIIATQNSVSAIDGDRTTNYVIAINELVGTDSSGQPLQAIKDILAQYPTARVLKLRPQLQSFRKGYANALVARPLFLKDPESRNMDQLEGFVRREMAAHQNKAVHVKYTVEGWSQNNNPFAIDTMVAVKDEVLGFDGNMYVLERHLTKSRPGKTQAHLTLCLPYSVALAA
jgi:hypothetical protein